MKTIWGFIKFLLFLVILGLVFHNFTAKLLLQAALHFSLGVPVEVGSAKIDFMSTQVEFRDIGIKNPEGFPRDRLLAYIPFLFLDFEISSIAERRLHFESIELNFKELSVVRSEQGDLNLLKLRVFAPSKKKTSESNTSPSSSEPVSLAVDRLILTLGRGVFTDLSSGEEKTFNLDINHEIYRDVRNMGDIAEIVTWEAMRRMGLQSILDQAIDRFGISKEAGGLLRSAVERLKNL